MFHLWLMGLVHWEPSIDERGPVLEWARPFDQSKSLGAEYSQPVVIDEHVYVGLSSAPGVFVFEHNTGIHISTLATDASVQSPSLIVGDVLYVADTSGVVYAFDRKAESLLWKKETGSPIMSELVYSEDTLVVSTVDNSVYRLSKNGELEWRHQYEASVSRAGELNIFGGSAPNIHNGFLYIGFSDGAVQKISLDKGEVVSTIWVGEGRYPDIVSKIGIAGDKVILSGFEGPTIAYDMDLSKEAWRIDAGRSADVLLDGQTLYLAQSNGSLSAIDVQLGSVLWEWSSKHNANLTSPVGVGTSLYLGSVEGSLYKLRKSDGKLLWEHKEESLDCGFSAPVMHIDNHLVAISNNRVLYSFSLKEHSHSSSGGIPPMTADSLFRSTLE
jgi:outer membrane protein assembly factor BamB